MSARGRSTSPHPLHDADIDMENGKPENTTAKVVIVTNLTRNVVETHLQTIFSFYGDIVKVDLPVYGKSGQNRGKAALEYAEPTGAQKAASHMNGGQLDGAILKVELSDLPIRSRSRSPRPGRGRNGKGRSRSYSPSRSRSPPARAYGRRDRFDRGDTYRARPYGRRGPPVRDTYRPYSRSRSRSRTRSRSPIRRGDRLPRRRSPSYERGGTGYRRGRTRSRSYSVRSSRSRSPSRSPRSRSRSSYSSYSRYSRSRSRSRSVSRARRSHSRDDIRDSRSRSPRD
ncbi:unnamed protein product [Somion occarium]|uniref:RRM domain-containing protein n=1 Tax=Somion occarium TaxID=3059160 RepID=A0ABP1D387_9APHY